MTTQLSHEAKASPTLSAAAKERLETQSASFLQRVQEATALRETLYPLSHAVQAMGNAEMAAVGETFLRQRNRPLLGSGSPEISAALDQLNSLVADLDPSLREGDLRGQRKLFGLIPLGSRLTAYFEEYEQAQGQLRQLMNQLRDGKDSLLRENIHIETQVARTDTLSAKLRHLIALTAEVDARLSEQLPAFAAQAEDKAKFVETELIYGLRQKHQDFLTQQLVAEQGRQVLSMARQGNLALMQGIERALNTTVHALMVAIEAARNLAGQRLMLNQIQEIQQTALATARRSTQEVRDQAADLSADAEPDLAELKQAFVELRQTLDQVTQDRDQRQAEIAKANISAETALAEAKPPPPPSSAPPADEGLAELLSP
jgi:uncharacterized protein YaaN involved in tellurite resistance